MTKRSSKLTLAVAVAALTFASCGAPGDDSGSGSSASDAAVEAAEALGIDLDDCPADMTDPLGDTAKVGLTLPLTGGPAAAFAVLGPGVKSAFEEANAEADLPTKFELILKDDQFQPDKTLVAARELVQKDGVVGFSGVTGTAGVLAIRDLLREECLPGIGLPGGGGTVLDPAYPEVVSGAVPFSLDARVWVEDVNERFPEGAKIATFIGNTESGKDYAEQIDHWLEETGSKSTIVDKETIDAADAAAPSSAVTTMRNSGAEVLFAAPTGAQCISIMTEAANQGWEPVIYMTTNCSSSTYFGAAGGAADGVLTLQTYKDVGSPRFADDAGVQRVRDVLKEYGGGVDLTNTTAYSGYVYGQMFVEAAKQAAASDLGLSKLGLIVAARNLDFHPDMVADGIDFTTSGLSDVAPIEAGELNSWSVAEGGFQQGKLYDFEGELTQK
ncbi:ABC transporter substrate-binding protein [Nocardioides sp. LHD-245]|uniref:ABC transporter substrate-binding protein n=1 Tax=Nocardioides sp. LHD-245 TaxID=3051387 RepID=UPI0027E13C10|nr:ABC transporter substrate-binding protein [Nocardioides sp. LHD-245]